MSKDYQASLIALGEVNKVVVSAHVSPDADAIGSSCGLALGLISLGLDVTVYLQDEIPEKFKAFTSGVNIVHDINQLDDDIELVIVVDTASEKRVGKAVKELRSKAPQTINIDHHISNDGWADLNIVKEASSCSILVFKFLEDMGAKTDAQIANLLLGGLLDDTGQFCFSNTNTEAFQVAALLLDKGASPHEIANQLYFSTPLKVTKLRAEALNKLEVLDNGRIGFLYVTQEMLNNYGATSEDTEGLVEEVRSIAGTVAAIFMRELEDKKRWKISLRAKTEDIDVNVVAGKFDGGGHKAAAGATIEGTLDDVKKRILAEL